MILVVDAPHEPNPNLKNMLDYCKGRIYLIAVLKHKYSFLDNMVICKLKKLRLWVYIVPNLEFMRINTKSPKFVECLNYHTQRVVLGY